MTERKRKGEGGGKEQSFPRNGRVRETRSPQLRYSIGEKKEEKGAVEGKRKGNRDKGGEKFINKVH